jgi:hypothetical protein
VHAVFELAERAPGLSYHSAPWPKS